AVWASGALIQDRLFAYGLLQYGRGEDNAYPGVLEGGANTEASEKAPNWLLKMDWNINDDNIIEFTGMSDKRDTETDYFETSFDADGSPVRGDYIGTDYKE